MIIGYYAVAVIFCALVWLIYYASNCHRKSLERKRKEALSLQKSLDEKTLAKEIHDLEVSLGITPNPKWKIAKEGSFWIISYGGKSYAASTSFSGAVEEYNTLMEKSSWHLWATEDESPSDRPELPKAPAATSRGAQSRSTPKGARYSLPKGPGPGGKRPFYTSNDNEVTRSMAFSCGWLPSANLPGPR